MKRIYIVMLSVVSYVRLQTMQASQRFQAPTREQVEERIRQDASNGTLNEHALNMHLYWGTPLGARIDARNAQGKSALDLALDNNHPAVVDLLIRRQSAPSSSR